MDNRRASGSDSNRFRFIPKKRFNLTQWYLVVKPLSTLSATGQTQYFGMTLTKELQENQSTPNLFGPSALIVALQTFSTLSEISCQSYVKIFPSAAFSTRPLTCKVFFPPKLIDRSQTVEIHGDA